MFPCILGLVALTVSEWSALLLLLLLLLLLVVVVVVVIVVVVILLVSSLLLFLVYLYCLCAVFVFYAGFITDAWAVEPVC
jgi:hypothetical protein